MPLKGQYIYAIIKTDRDADFGAISIGKEKTNVYTVTWEGLGAVISDSPVQQYPVTRANTIAHQHVMETIMPSYPMLPVRFGTVSEGVDLIREKLLSERKAELMETLAYMEDKVELGLKGIWKEMKPVFDGILSRNSEISRFRDRLLKRRGGAQRDQMRLGEMVKDALQTLKEDREKELLRNLDGLWIEKKLNNHFGDQMILNAAFLVKKENENLFDDAVETISDTYGEEMTFKYVGPVPPCNFVEIVVKW